MGTFKVKISINEDEYLKEMKMAEKQVEYAKLLALGMTAGNGKVGQVQGKGGAREDLKSGLKRFMTIRSRPATGGYMGGSIRSTRATKNKVYADVGTINSDLMDQALGARHSNPKGEAVPAVGKGLARPTLMHKTTKARWAGSQINKDMQKQPGARRLFVIQGGSGNKLVMRKVGSLKKRQRQRGTSPRVRSTAVRGKGGDAVVMWSIAPDVKIEAVWPLKRLVQLSVMRHWQTNAAVAFRYAFETRR